MPGRRDGFGQALGVGQGPFVVAFTAVTPRNLNRANQNAGGQIARFEAQRPEFCGRAGGFAGVNGDAAALAGGLRRESAE